MWKGVFDCQHHLTKNITVTLVYNKDKPLLVNGINICRLQGSVVIADVAHFLD